MWNVAAPATISTSCSARAQLERHGVAGQRAHDVDEQPRRQDDRALADRPRRRAAPAARSPCRWRATRCRAPRRASWTPDSAWTALRVEAARVTVWSCANSASRCVESFISLPASQSTRTTTQERAHRHRGVEGVHNRRRSRKLRLESCAAACAHGRESVSAAAASRGPAASAEDLGQAADGLVCVGVVGDALRRPPVGVQDGRVVAAAEGAADRRQRLRRSARARGTSRSAAAMRLRRRGSTRRAPRPRGRTPRRSRSWISRTVIARRRALRSG